MEKESPEWWWRQRRRMVESQLRARGIVSPGVLGAMETVPRENFVPEESRWRAYCDGPLPIGFGQTISQPYIVALMTELAGPNPCGRVLEVGTGSGYGTAVLAALWGRVFTLERIPALWERARSALERLSLRNVELRCGDGWMGWPEAAPFDAIVVAAAAPEVPETLVRQLSDGGNLVIPVGVWEQELLLVTRQGDMVSSRTICPVQFVPFVKGGPGTHKDDFT